MNRMPEVGETSATINLQGSLGHEAHYFGRDAFSKITDAFSARAKQRPEFAGVLQKFAALTHSDTSDVVRELHINDHRSSKNLSERLLGKWVSLAAEKSLLDAKPMSGEADGARWTQIEGEVVRLENSILLAHKGEKSVTLDENIVHIIADPSGDMQKKIMDGLQDVNDAVYATVGRTAVKLTPLAVAGSMLFSSCSGGSIIPSPEITPTGITQAAPTVEPPTVTPEVIRTPTNIPIPDTMVDEVGAPLEVKQFAGSPESLQPMIDAITQQFGFTPSNKELAGFTVTGAKGEGNYFLVTHNGVLYTIFAHADGGRFATVKVDGVNKTSDFAIFKMTRIDRDASTVWWGIDDGHGGIAQPMFEFTLNSDGSTATASFVEPKSGASIQLLDSAMQIQFESKALFKYKEPLGGSEVAYLYEADDIPMPEGVKSLLVPSSPDTWVQTGLSYADGTPFPWDTSIIALRENKTLLVAIPVLVRGVVEIPEPFPEFGAGAKRMFIVLETPVRGGSNFVIINMKDNMYSRPTMDLDYLLSAGIPLNWAQTSWENPMNVGDFVAGYKFTGSYDGKKIADTFKQYIGQTVVVSFSTSSSPTSGTPSLQQIAERELIDKNGQSVTANFIPFEGLTLPYKSP